MTNFWQQPSRTPTPYAPPVRPTATVALSRFDPGPNASGDRWALALTAAMAASSGNPIAILIDGDYTLSSQITIAQQVILVGVYNKSFLRWNKVGSAGLLFVSGSSYSTLEGITLVGPSQTSGTDIGIKVQAGRIYGSRLYINRWAGTGVYFDGSATIANECSFSDVALTFCGKSTSAAASRAGMYFVGGDGNANVLINCAATDCRRGFADESFLGNFFFGCSVEACNDGAGTGYGFIAKGANTRATFVGCYVESDSQSDVDAPSGFWGGLVASNRGNGNVYTGRGAYPLFSVGAPFTDAVGGHTWELDVNIGQVGTPNEALNITTYDYTSASVPEQPTRLRYGGIAWAANWWRLNYAGLDAKDFIRWKGGQIWFPLDVMRGYPNASSGMREVVTSDPATATAAGPSDGGSWYVGDRLIIKTPVWGEPSGYVCVAVSGGVPSWAPTGIVGGVTGPMGPAGEDGESDMSSNKRFRFGPVALTTTTTTNLLNPPTATGGTNAGSSANYIVLTHIRIVNKTAGSATCSFWLGGTGGNVAGTEVIGQGLSVAANSVVDWNGYLRLDSADYLVGGASANTTLTIQGEGEIGVA